MNDKLEQLPTIEQLQDMRLKLEEQYASLEEWTLSETMEGPSLFFMDNDISYSDPRPKAEVISLADWKTNNEHRRNSTL